MRARVVLEHELLGHLALVALAGVLEVEALAVLQHAVADLEDLGVGVDALGRDRDRVEACPTGAFEIRWRSSSDRTAFSRLRYCAACSNSCSSAAFFIPCSSARSIWR